MPIELAAFLPFGVVEPWDKLGHFLWFAALTGLLWSITRGRAPFAVLAAVMAFGALDEICQAFDPARNADLLDFAANSLAAATVVLILKRKSTCAESLAR